MLPNKETFCILGYWVELELSVPKVVEFPCKVGTQLVEILWGDSRNIDWDYDVPQRIKEFGMFLLFANLEIGVSWWLTFRSGSNRMVHSLPDLEDYLLEVYPDIRVKKG